MPDMMDPKITDAKDFDTGGLGTPDPKALETHRQHMPREARDRAEHTAHMQRLDDEIKAELTKKAQTQGAVPQSAKDREWRLDELRFEKPFEHLNFISTILKEDERFIIAKDQEYNASWLRRGGTGAFMMLARKWDRLEPLVARYGYDVFAMLKDKPDRIDDLEDLCRYLDLVRAEWRRRQTAPTNGQKAQEDF